MLLLCGTFRPLQGCQRLGCTPVCSTGGAPWPAWAPVLPAFLPLLKPAQPIRLSAPVLFQALMSGLLAPPVVITGILPVYNAAQDIFFCGVLKKDPICPVMEKTMQRKQQGLSCAVFLLTLCTLTMLRAAPARAEFWNTADDYWALMFGYGQSFPGWGQTEERVHSFEFAPRYSHLTIDGIGSGWWAGRHDTLIELPITVVGGPGFDTSAMAGLNLLAAYTFTADDCWQPYVFGGGGILYSFADIPGMGAHWNGNYQFAGGLRYRLDDLHALLFEARYHHISNAGSADPNVPLNGIRLMIGYAF